MFVRMAAVVAVSGFALVAMTAACSSSNDSGSASSGGTSTSSSSGSNTSTSSSTSSSGGTGSGFKQCPTPGQNTSSCTQAEIDAYDNCPINNCDAELQECFGSGYKTGSFGGACGTYVSCSQKCACGDTACQQACGLPDQNCQTCLQKYSSCYQAKCPEPACMKTGSSTSSTSSSSSSTGGTAKTCADLQTCCNGLTDAQKKSTCLQGYDAIKASGDAACAQAYSALCQ